MSKKKLILIGGGGHCKSCIDVIESTDLYDIIGILDLPSRRDNKLLNYEIVGSDDECGKYKDEGCEFMVTVGQINTSKPRKRIFQSLNVIDAKLAIIISPFASVSKYSKIGRGTIVMHGVNINAGVEVGENTILNTGCNIEHDVVIGNHCHISTHAVVNGGSRIGDDTFIGSNSTVSNGVAVGSSIIIGAGAVVLKSLVKPGIYIGNPARITNS